MATWTSEEIDEKINYTAYEVQLNEKGKLQWVAKDGAEPVYYTKEPNTSWWTR